MTFTPFHVMDQICHLEIVHLFRAPFEEDLILGDDLQCSKQQPKVRYLRSFQPPLETRPMFFPKSPHMSFVV